MQQAFTLSLINSRFYQTNLENLYISALNVTLQRFAFAAAVLRGHVAPDGPARLAIPGAQSRQTSSTTRRGSRRAARSRTSQLGEVAGVGKLFNSGGQLLQGFANQVVFNFVGKNPIQPTVQSSLPLTFVQPFLRGGGRAVVLENLTQAERSLLYQARAFAKFRQEFIVTILTGGTVQNFGSTFNLAGFSTAGNIDPIVGFIPVVVDLVSRSTSTARTSPTSSSSSSSTSSSSRARRRACRSSRSTRRGLSLISATGTSGQRHADLPRPTSTSSASSSACPPTRRSSPT